MIKRFWISMKVGTEIMSIWCLGHAAMVAVGFGYKSDPALAVLFCAAFFIFQIEAEKIGQKVRYYDEEDGRTDY